MDNCKNKPLNKPFKSNRKYKKLQVCVKDGTTTKNIHFGDNRYKDFTQHKDKNRRKNFRARHNCSKANNKLSARYWACEALW